MIEREGERGERDSGRMLGVIRPASKLCHQLPLVRVGRMRREKHGYGGRGRNAGERQKEGDEDATEGEAER